jgi:hypothetical protein
MPQEPCFEPHSAQTFNCARAKHLCLLDLRLYTKLLNSFAINNKPSSKNPKYKLKSWRVAQLQ